MNPTLQAISSSLMRAINAQKQPGDIDLGLGEPQVRPDPAWFEQATEWVRRHGCPYTANAGSLELRTAIASHYRYPGLDAANNVCVTVGSQEALYLAIKALCDPAQDEVVIVGPCYPAYPKLCQLEGVACRVVALDPKSAFAPDARRVLEQLSPATRLLLLASPANPTGRVWPAAELERLARGLAARQGPPVYVLLDEVYRELDYTGTPPVPFAALYPHTFVANSLSKSHALTGLRLGWLMGPAQPMAEVIKAHQFITTAASTFSQQVALAAFADPRGLDYQQAHYARRREQLVGWLTELELEFIPPEGAFYCMVKLPPALAGDSLAAAYALLESRRVLTIPGAAFGAEGWLRLSWVAEAPALESGLRHLAASFKAPR